MTQNQIAYWNLQETKRSNVSRESETARHNIADETETKRHNVQTETETSRHNLAGESESKRHNIESERFNISQLQETYRHNVAGENINISQLQETHRHNVASEKQDEIANAIKQEANRINQAYNDAITSIRRSELNLSKDKEVQRILESQRDFNEAVRVNDAKMMVDAIKAGGDAVRAITGNDGLLSTSALAAGALGGTAAYKTSKLLPQLKKAPTKGANIAKNANMSTLTKLAPPKDLTFFLIPDPVLDIFKDTLYGTERGGLGPNKA